MQVVDRKQGINVAWPKMRHKRLQVMNRSSSFILKPTWVVPDIFSKTPSLDQEQKLPELA